MKELIMCEGPNELEIINFLLENDKLIYSYDDLLGLRAYHARQISKSAIVRNELNIYNGEVEILRIGDKMTDVLAVPKDYQTKVISQSKYCTKPELEMLLIVSEGLYSEYQKVKSTMKPKEFCKKHIIHNGVRYNNTTNFYTAYYGNRVDLLVRNILEYKRLNKSHSRNELYLADLLKH